MSIKKNLLETSNIMSQESKDTPWRNRSKTNDMQWNDYHN